MPTIRVTIRVKFVSQLVLRHAAIQMHPLTVLMAVVVHQHKQEQQTFDAFEEFPFC
jgi:hypothetical protein